MAYIQMWDPQRRRFVTVSDEYVEEYKKQGLTTKLPTKEELDWMQKNPIAYSDTISQPKSNTAQYPSAQYPSAQYPSMPQYESPYQKQIDALLNEVINYKPFTYDVEKDPMYQAYKERYQQAGAEAFQNTIGDLAGLTGGRMNTWAISAASQARQSWNERLMDVVPELYNLAYSMYMQELNNKYNQLSALSGLEARDYQRYRDLIDDIRYQQEFEYKQLQDKLAQERYEKEWEYGVERDKIADERYLQEWLHQLDREKVADDRYLREWLYQLERDKKADERYEREWEYMVSQDEYARMNQEEKEAYERYWREKLFDYQVSKDEYERMDREEKKAYDRYWQEKLFEYGVQQDELNRAERAEERAYQRWLDSLKFKEEQTPTAGQLANYNSILNGLLNRFDNPTDALRYVNQIGKQTYVDLIGEDLYNQLLQDLLGGYQEDTIPALYSEMMRSPDPKQWLIDNAIYLTSNELKELIKYLPDQTDEEFKKYLEDILR